MPCGDRRPSGFVADKGGSDSHFVLCDQLFSRYALYSFSNMISVESRVNLFSSPGRAVDKESHSLGLSLMLSLSVLIVVSRVPRFAEESLRVKFFLLGDQEA